MEVVICADAAEIARLAARRIAQVVRASGPNPVLGVATGSSPVATYECLASMVNSGALDLSGASAFALDEYIGLAPGHPESYTEVIRRTVTEPLGIDPSRVHVPNGFAEDVDAAAEEFEAAIKAAGGVDIQVLGVGGNGHIGFNEPTSALSSRTWATTLTQQTREDNGRFFDSTDEVPFRSITQGLGTIMDARNLLLLAQGAHKAAATAALVEGPLTAKCPGSVLQWHKHATVIIDQEAAGQLEMADYYVHAFAHNPDWVQAGV